MIAALFSMGLLTVTSVGFLVSDASESKKNKAKLQEMDSPFSPLLDETKWYHSETGFYYCCKVNGLLFRAEPHGFSDCITLSCLNKRGDILLSWRINNSEAKLIENSFSHLPNHIKLTPLPFFQHIKRIVHQKFTQDISPSKHQTSAQSSSDTSISVPRDSPFFHVIKSIDRLSNHSKWLMFEEEHLLKNTYRNDILHLHQTFEQLEPDLKSSVINQVHEAIQHMEKQISTIENSVKNRKKEHYYNQLQSLELQ